jgi:hypothetical protein
MTQPQPNTLYEWCTETRDEYEDITDTSVWPSKDEAVRFARDTERTAVVLIRDTPTERLWAYGAIEGDLPEVFSDAYGDQTAVRVPARFRK